MSERTQNNEGNIENQLENNTIKDENKIEIIFLLNKQKL